MRKFLQTLRAQAGFEDLLILAGAAGFLYGLAQYSPPAAWMVAGAALIIIGVRR